MKHGQKKIIRRQTAQHLENTFKPNLKRNTEELQEILNEKVRIIPPVSPREVEKTIKEQISSKKAPDYDLITESNSAKTTSKKSNYKTYTTHKRLLQSEECT